MTKLTVRVTQVDIDKGKPHNACRCPVALAIKRLGYGSSVGRKEIYIHNVMVLISTPIKAAKFITAFDNGQPVKPFQFTIKGEL